MKVGTTDHSQEEVLLIPFRFTNTYCLVRAKPWAFRNETGMAPALGQCYLLVGQTDKGQ